MLENMEKIINLSKERIKYLEKRTEPWYKWYETYISGIKNELQEVEDELKGNNTVFLETELWDIFWAYICLLHSLEENWYINNKENIFERCYKKFSERLSWIEKWLTWDDIKKIQKKELEIEHDNILKKSKKV